MHLLIEEFYALNPRDRQPILIAEVHRSLGECPLFLVSIDYLSTACFLFIDECFSCEALKSRSSSQKSFSFLYKQKSSQFNKKVLNRGRDQQVINLFRSSTHWACSLHLNIRLMAQQIDVIQLNSSSTISNKEINIKEVPPFPVGSLISSQLSSHAVGDLLQVHEFLCRFQEVLEVKQDCLSYDDLENELLTPSTDAYGFGEKSFLETVENSFLKSKVDKLTIVHMTLLPSLVTKLLRKLAKNFDIQVDPCYAKHNKGKKIKLDLLPINALTWPEVARKYIMACLLMGDENNCHDTKLIRYLQGDDGIFSGSPTGVAGADVDAQLLGKAVEKVFGKMKRERSIKLSAGTKLDHPDKYRLETDSSIPQWAKVLDPVRKLATNVGSRIRNCVREALEKNPPEWAKEILEHSISKEVYKGNASGPTKQAVIRVLEKLSGGPQTEELPPGTCKEEVKSSKMLSDTVMKKCRVVLRQVAGLDRNRVLSDIVGRNFDCDDNDLKIIFGNVSRRPLDLRTIDMRLEHGAYGGSHEAFLEDVREMWINLRKTYMTRPNLVKLVDEMSCDFKLRYEEEVGTLFKRLYEHKINKKPLTEIEKELEDLLTSTETPKVPWETGICKLCGLNRDDTNVLLCDTEGCNAEYHTYCLNPPLDEIPEGDWFCPTCVPPNKVNKAEGLEHVLQFVGRNCEETARCLDITTALDKKEYWQLDADKKTFLLKFLCDELLKTRLIRTNLKESVPTRVKSEIRLSSDSHPTKDLSNLSLRKEFLGTDSENRLYWGFPNTNTSTHHGIVVHEGKTVNSHAWSVFQSNDQIKALVDFLKRNDPTNKYLRNSISKWQKSTTRQHGQQTKGETVISHDGLATKASGVLEARYNTKPDSMKKPRRKNKEKWHRCECLEPVLPCRYHCVKCHETFFTNVEFEQHKKSSDCGSGAVDRGQPTTTTTTLGVVSGGCNGGLKQLKICLLDMEAALPDGGKRESRASSEWRSEWCAFVKSANTIYEMVEATVILETMIKTEYIKNTWWWYWSSMEAATKTSTISALALRIYTLDAAIDYQKTTTTTSSGQKQSKKRKRTVLEVKKGRKKLENKQEMKEQLQDIIS